MVTVPSYSCYPYPGKISLKTPIKDLTLESNGKPVAGVIVSPEESGKTLSLAVFAAPISPPQGDSPVFWGREDAPRKFKPGAAAGPADLPHKWDTRPDQRISQEGVHQVHGSPAPPCPLKWRGAGMTCCICADGCHQKAGKPHACGAVQSISETSEMEYKKGQR